nr:DNA-binding domain-containing protein [Paracoccus saliphilus]
MHADLLSRFQDALAGAGLPPGVTAREPSEIQRRFSVYRNNVAVSLSDALTRRFPVIRQLVGDDFFRVMARAYIAEAPPRTPVLAEWGDDFPDFLEGFPALSDWPYMADVARIEFARGLAYHAADAPPLNPSALAAADFEGLVLHLHPSVIVLRLSHPAVAIWARHQPQAQHLPLPSGPQIALILRDASLAVPVEAISRGDAALIEGLAEGRTLASAAHKARRVQPHHDPQPRLVSLIRAGALAGIRE